MRPLQWNIATLARRGRIYAFRAVHWKKAEAFRWQGGDFAFAGTTPMAVLFIGLRIPPESRLTKPLHSSAFQLKTGGSRTAPAILPASKPGFRRQEMEDSSDWASIGASFVSRFLAVGA